MATPEQSGAERVRTFAELSGSVVPATEIKSALKVYLDAGALIPTNVVVDVIRNNAFCGAEGDKLTEKDLAEINEMAEAGAKLDDTDVADSYNLLKERLDAEPKKKAQ